MMADVHGLTIPRQPRPGLVITEEEYFDAYAPCDQQVASQT
jgi:hypothetical protein